MEDMFHGMPARDGDENTETYYGDSDQHQFVAQLPPSKQQPHINHNTCPNSEEQPPMLLRYLHACDVLLPWLFEAVQSRASESNAGLSSGFCFRQNGMRPKDQQQRQLHSMSHSLMQLTSSLLMVIQALKGLAT